MIKLFLNDLFAGFPRAETDHIGRKSDEKVDADTDRNAPAAEAVPVIRMRPFADAVEQDVAQIEDPVDHHRQCGVPLPSRRRCLSEHSGQPFPQCASAVASRCIFR